MMFDIYLTLFLDQQGLGWNLRRILEGGDRLSWFWASMQIHVDFKRKLLYLRVFLNKNETNKELLLKIKNQNGKRKLKLSVTHIWSFCG